MLALVFPPTLSHSPIGTGVPEVQSSPFGAVFLWFLPFPCGASNSEAFTGEKSRQGCKSVLPGASGEVQPSLVLPGVGKLYHSLERIEQASCVSRTEPDNGDNSKPCTCSRNNEGVYINRTPCNCAKMITLPLRLLRAHRLLGFVYGLEKHLWFVLTTVIVWACMVLGRGY